MVWDIEDYLDNYLKNKLKSDESFAKEAVDPEYYGEALSEIAATNSRKRKKKHPCMIPVLWIRRRMAIGMK